MLTLLPDLEDDLLVALGQVEELLLTLAAWGEDPDGPGPFVLPAPPTGRATVDALNRLQNALASTQTRSWPEGSEGRRTCRGSGALSVIGVFGVSHGRVIGQGR